MSNSPAEILRASLVVAALGTLRSINTNGDWPVFVGHMPNKPNNAICIYDTAGIREGRLQKVGTSISKPGWQVRVRATDHTTGFSKISAIREHIDGILRESITISSVSYTIQAAKQTSTILPLGQEPDGEKRDLFTLNGTLTYTMNT